MAERVSQISRQTVVIPTPTLHVSQQARQTTVLPTPVLRISQICRMTVLQLSGEKLVYCWVRQKNHPTISAVTPVTVFTT